MRRICSLLVLISCFFPMAFTRAEVVTPTEARDSAIDAEQTLIELNNYLADQYFHQGNFDQAVNAFDRVTIINPVGIEPYSTAAWLLWSSGKNDQALDFYQRMIAANPNNPDGYFELGLFYVRLHNDTEAVKWLGRAVQLGLRAPKNHLYGLALTRLGRNEEALAFWRQVLADSPNDEIAQREIGRLTNKDKDKPPTQPAAPQQTPNKK